MPYACIVRVLRRGGGTKAQGYLSTHDIVVLDPIGLAPGAHDKGVIESQDGHEIDLLALDFVQLLNVTWQMTHRAAWGERSGHGEEYDFLIGPFFGRVV